MFLFTCFISFFRPVSSIVVNNQMYHIFNNNNYYYYDFVDHTLSQRQLSDRLEDVQLNNLFDAASCADKARLLSTSYPHASAWLTVVPSDSLGLHLQPHLFQTAIRWWLGISHTASPEGNPLVCPLCPGKALDTLGHHCTTCKCGGDVTNRHNMLRNALFSTFRHASLSAHLDGQVKY